MSKLFISHSSQDDAFVRDLRAALADHGQDGWIDSRELRGGDPLWPEIQKAIEEASGYAVLVSTDGLQSKWVGKELRHALELRDDRGKDKFPVIPLSLNSTKLGVLEEFFGEEPLYIPVSSDAGGVVAASSGETRAAALALFGMVGFTFGFLGPLAVGLVVDLGGGREEPVAWLWAFAVMALGSVVSTLAMAWKLKLKG